MEEKDNCSSRVVFCLSFVSEPTLYISTSLNRFFCFLTFSSSKSKSSTTSSRKKDCKDLGDSVKQECASSRGAFCGAIGNSVEQRCLGEAYTGVPAGDSSSSRQYSGGSGQHERSPLPPAWTSKGSSILIPASQFSQVLEYPG
jgi:hypothetical protein